MEKSPFLLLLTSKRVILGTLVLFLLIQACSLPRAIQTIQATSTATPQGLPSTPIPPTSSPLPSPTPTPIPAARIEGGDYALFIGDWEGALEEFQTARSASAEPEIQAAALLGIGRVRYYTGDLAQALDVLRELVGSYPASAYSPAGYFYLGQIYTSLARYPEAIEAYTSYLSLRPGVIDTYILEWRGDAHFAMENYPAALSDFLAAWQSPHLGDGFPLQIKIAETYSITGDYATAILMYNDIYSRTTDDYTRARVDYLLGQTYLASGQADQAYTAYLDAVQNYPLAYPAYLALIELVEAGYPVDELDRGLVDYYAGEYDVANAAFDRYLGVEPPDPAKAYYYKGLSLSALGDYVGAIESWDQVIQKHGDSDVWDNAWEMKAYTQWYFLDQYDEAVQTLNGFIEAAPVHPRAAEFLFDAGRAAERAGNLGKAAKLWERVVAEYPTSEQAFRSLFLAGVSYFRQKDFIAAQDAFQRLLGISVNIGQRATSYFWIAKSLSALGDSAGASANWELAANADPTGYYSERARDILAGNPPFTPPQVFDLAVDWAAERAEAEAWLQTTFSLPAGTNLSDRSPILNDARLQRGTELWSLGLFSQARQEFEDMRQALAADPANTYLLVNYLLELGLYRSAILGARQLLTMADMDDAATMNAPAYFNHIRFGTYYGDLIIPLAQSHNLHPILVFSALRQESLFESFVQSSAGARGLMQIMPPTGQSIADQLVWPENYSAADLDRALVNITFGVEYLHDQRNYLDGDLYAALAAYNGGPGNASQWKSLAEDDPDLFLEIIRFDETRLYIQRIYEIFAIYRRLYARTP